jgi:hypothetical protein
MTIETVAVNAAGIVTLSDGAAGLGRVSGERFGGTAVVSVRCIPGLWCAICAGCALGAAEQFSFNPLVLGSSPRRPTPRIRCSG